MTRRAALAALTAGAAVVLAGCAAAGPTPGATFSARASGPLTGWGFNNADDVGKARLAAAAKALPGVDTTLDQTTFDAVKFVTRIASNTVPDVVQMDTASVDTYAAQGLIVPLDACFAAHDVDPAERWYPQIVSTIRYRDHVWAVPQFYQPPAIVLNHRVLQAAGADAADFDTSDREALVATAKRLTVFRGSSPVRLGFDPQGSGNLQLWLLGGGGTIVDARGRPRLDTAANARTLEFLKRLYDAQGGYARVKSLVDSFDQFGERNQFARDQVAAEVQPQWYVNVLAPYRDALDVRATPFRDAEGDPYTTAGSTAFVIPAGAKHLDAACAWALALTDPSAWEAAGAARARTVAQDDDGINTGLFTGSPAADRAVRERYVKDTGDRGFDQVIGTYYGILDDGGSPGATPAGAPIGQALTNAFTSVVLGEQSAASALAAAQTKAELAYRRATANE